MEDNLHDKLIESNKLYGEYEMPNDALDNYRKYEANQLKARKNGLFKYLITFVLLTFIASTSYLLISSSKMKAQLIEKLKLTTLKEEKEQKTENANLLIPKESSEKAIFLQRKMSSKQSILKNKTFIKTSDNTETKNTRYIESASKNIARLSQEITPPSNLVINVNKDSLSSKKELGLSSTKKSYIYLNEDQFLTSKLKHELNQSIKEDTDSRAINNHQTIVDELHFPVLKNRSTAPRSVEEAQDLRSNLTVCPLEEIKVIHSMKRYKYLIGINRSWVNQFSNHYPSLSGAKLAIQGGLMISPRLLSRITFSVLHQNGHVETIDAASEYAFDTPDLPIGTSFEKLNFDRYAASVNLGLDYTYHNSNRIQAFYGAKYHLEASQIQDIHNFYKKNSSEEGIIILPNGEVQISNYIGLTTGATVSAWRNISVALEVQYFQSLNSKENSYYSVGMGLNFAF